MPNKDGMETIAEVRRDFPNVKIIAMSGRSQEGFDALSLAGKLGAFRTLVKPFDLDELLLAVEEALSA